MISRIKELEEELAAKIKEKNLLKQLEEANKDIEASKARLFGSDSIESIRKPQDTDECARTPLDLTCIIEEARETPPLKKLKQINLMQGFNISVSNTNKAGVTTILTPGTVEDSEPIVTEFKCDKCPESFHSKFNLSRHKVMNCRALQPKVNIYRPRYACNRGSNSRHSYTNQQKMAAVLFYNSFPAGKQGIAIEYSRNTGIPVDTVRKWLLSETARRDITREKRMCTLQMCIRAEGSQPPITIIFRGADEKYYRNEREEYDARVHILYQKKAWADRPTSEAWVREVLHPHIDGRTAAEGIYRFSEREGYLQASIGCRRNRNAATDRCWYRIHAEDYYRSGAGRMAGRARSFGCMGRTA